MRRLIQHIQQPQKFYFRVRCLLIFSIKRRSKHSGEGGIRTLGTLRYTRFPIVHLRPLGHLSSNLRRGGSPRRIGLSVAEREGFEPPVPCGTLDFESSAFDQLGHLSMVTVSVVWALPAPPCCDRAVPHCPDHARVGMTSVISASPRGSKPTPPRSRRAE